jgi:hypothetical protein
MTSVKITQRNGSLSFTLGELVVLQQYDPNIDSLGDGFTNSSNISIIVLSVQEHDANLLKVANLNN